ncbi:ABC transporter ATP-binding protein [Exiguobacterium sp. UBA3968]|uniref:ABC transporter ATP-binding protein n=1 Tax=Exiguobacterium sp. UBA3968 TaxID=1946492 RepID=UPI0025B9D837|nr:phosphate ABC transporter ATP-binding protein [Exiguobacterium sp. UBA3968]
MSILTFHEVSYQHILHELTGEFREGVITTLIGPSGAGKSTTLKHINGLISPDRGEICFRGEPLEQMNLLDVRKRIGMAFQSAPMIPGTVYDNINLPKSIIGESLPREEAERLLQQVELSVELERPVKDLSGGERSRLGIARTLVNRPDVLLLDEITASLDYRMVQEIEKLILDLQQELQTTIIWITHDLEQAKRVSDDVWFLKDGRLIESGAFKELVSSGQAETQAFLKGVSV